MWAKWLLSCASDAPSCHVADVAGTGSSSVGKLMQIYVSMRQSRFIQWQHSVLNFSCSIASSVVQ